MKLAKSLALIINASFAIPFALAYADFHIVQVIGSNGYSRLHAYPSKNYNCHCFMNGRCGAQVLVGGEEVGSLPESFFSLESGFCGSGLGELNFYKLSNGVWNFYESDGNGVLKGACYSNTASTSCMDSGLFYSNGGTFNDQLICYSYICDH